MEKLLPKFMENASELYESKGNVYVLHYLQYKVLSELVLNT